MKKAEMIEVLETMESYSYYSNNASFTLIEKLLLSTDENDADLQAVPSGEILEQVVTLLVDAYTGDDLLKWLEKRKYDILTDFRFAEMYEYDEIDADELDDMKADALFNDEENRVMVYSW